MLQKIRGRISQEVGKLILIILVGCTTINEGSIEEAKRQTRLDVVRACENDIFWGLISDYPLTDYTTYRIWLEMGGTGPSPSEFCHAYAQEVVR